MSILDELEDAIIAAGINGIPPAVIYISESTRDALIKETIYLTGKVWTDIGTIRGIPVIVTDAVDTFFVAHGLDDQPKGHRWIDV